MWMRNFNCVFKFLRNFRGEINDSLLQEAFCCVSSFLSWPYSKDSNSWSIWRAGLHIGAILLDTLLQGGLLDVPALHWSTLQVGPYKWDLYCLRHFCKGIWVWGHSSLVAYWRTAIFSFNKVAILAWVPPSKNLVNFRVLAQIRSSSSKT